MWQIYYFSELIKINSNLISYNLLIYSNNSLVHQGFGTWNYYIKWINVYI